MSEVTLDEVLNGEELRLFGLIIDAHNGIHALGLSANEGELAHATHTLQGFVIQHALHRLHPYFSDWYEGE